ncbi:MAG: hypothetical protein ACFE8J_12025 [Candidatus Heimdallarchaeota archaeon]
MTIKDDTFLIEAFKHLKCIKCGYDYNIMPLALRNILYIKKFRKSRFNYRLSSLFIPVCMRCILEFQAWKRFKTNFIKSFLKSAIFTTFISILIWNIYNNLWGTIIIISLFIGIFIAYNVNLYRKLKKMEYFPKKYMKFDKKGDFYVKSEKSSTWKEYIHWLKDTIYEVKYLNEFYYLSQLNERKKQFINCIYCGEKVKRKDIKCFNCGKLLPLL